MTKYAHHLLDLAVIAAIVFALVFLFSCGSAKAQAKGDTTHPDLAHLLMPWNTFGDNWDQRETYLANLSDYAQRLEHRIYDLEKRVDSLEKARPIWFGDGPRTEILPAEQMPTDPIGQRYYQNIYALPTPHHTFEADSIFWYNQETGIITTDTIKYTPKKKRRKK